MLFKYKLEHLACEYCLRHRKCNCYKNLCPYIMENVNDLFADSKFREAVINADNCTTLHRYTLLYIKKQAIKRGSDLFYNPKPVRWGIKPACESCSYNSVGFICYSKKDGTCLQDWIRKIYHAGG